MDKQQKLKIALPILVIIMAFVWGPIITGSKSKHKSANTPADSKAASSLPGSSADLIAFAHSNQRNKTQTSYTDWGRNPFTLARSSKPSVLEGIMWDAQNPKAIIDGNIFGIGDKTGSGEIVDIQPNSVIIKSGNVQTEYRLGL